MEMRAKCSHPCLNILLTYFLSMTNSNRMAQINSLEILATTMTTMLNVSTIYDVNSCCLLERKVHELIDRVYYVYRIPYLLQ